MEGCNSFNAQDLEHWAIYMRSPTKFSKNKTKEKYMIGISGLTDVWKQRDSIAINVSLGEPRKIVNNRPQFGADLKESFRVESKHPGIDYLLKEAYGKAPKTLNIYLPYSELGDVFTCEMAAYTTSGCTLRCNREKIQERNNIVEADGHKYRTMKKVDEPCPIAGKPQSMACPNGCKATGKLKFFIAEVFHGGFRTKLAQLDWNGWTHFRVLKDLQSLYEQMGSLSNSPFPSPLTEGYIPLILSRVETACARPIMEQTSNGYKRTGNYSDPHKQPAYAITVDVHPKWLAAWHNYRNYQQMQELGMAVDPRLLMGYWQPAENINFLPPVTQQQLSTVPALAIAPSETNEYANKIKAVAENNNISLEVFKDLLQNKLGWLIQDWSDISSAEDYVKVEEVITQHLQTEKFRLGFIDTAKKSGVDLKDVMAIASKALDRNVQSATDIQSEQEYFAVCQAILDAAGKG